MHLAIDALHLFGAYSGVQFSLARQVAALREHFPADRLTLFVPRDYGRPAGPAAVASSRDREGAAETPLADARGSDPALLPTDDPGLRVHRTWFPGRWRAVRTLWRNLRLQKWAYRGKCDLLHGGTYALPPALSLPAVVTVHDTIALTHPQFCTPGSARIQKLLLPRAVKAAHRVLVPTAAVQAEVERLLGAEPRRIDVVPWGVGPEFRVITGRAALDEARDQWKLPARFALYVGTLEPKKNIEGLLKGFFAAKLHRKLPHALVLAGRMGWKMKALPRLVRELNARDYVYFTGYVPPPALPLLYNLAEVCVLPSHVEGFGMPVLEAMACGCPVVVSDAPALVEVAGDAARVCVADPDRPHQALREALEEILLDQGRVRATLRERGLARARQFTWARTAQLTHAAYLRALEGR